MSHEEHQNAAHGSHGSGYGGAPKGYAVQHSPADENKRGREEGETLHYTLYPSSPVPGSVPKAHPRRKLSQSSSSSSKSSKRTA